MSGIENNGNGYYAIINSDCAQVYGFDIPGAGGRWFATKQEAQDACDAYNAEHATDASEDYEEYDD